MLAAARDAAADRARHRGSPLGRADAARADRIHRREDTEAPLALVCSARPELAEVSPGFLGTDGRRRTVELQTLGTDQAAALLTDLTGDPALAETPFASALIANAGGNPLFLEETVRMLRDHGLIDLERWRSGEIGDLPIPTSVQGLISSRLDRLAREEKQLAHHASVVGAVFWAGAVAHLGLQDGTPPTIPVPASESSNVVTSSRTRPSPPSRARTSTRSSTS